MSSHKKDIVILDVRTKDEYQETHVKGSVLIDFLQADFPSKVEGLDKQACYKVYCRSGNRSGRAMELMKSMGFVDVENLGSVAEASENLKIDCE